MHASPALATQMAPIQCLVREGAKPTNRPMFRTAVKSSQCSQPAASALYSNAMALGLGMPLAGRPRDDLPVELTATGAAWLQHDWAKTLAPATTFSYLASST